jgi:hypothetical protein
VSPATPRPTASQVNAAGQVELKLKTPWRDATMHLVTSPLEFMQRLAALVPRPRLHLIRFQGVLAPNARLRSSVVRKGPPVPQGPAAEAALVAECEVETAEAQPHRISWARLLKRVFGIDMPHCPNCGGGSELKIIAAILERPVIEKIRIRPANSSCGGEVAQGCSCPRHFIADTWTLQESSYRAGGHGGGIRRSSGSRLCRHVGSPACRSQPLHWPMVSTRTWFASG